MEPSSIESNFLEKPRVVKSFEELIKSGLIKYDARAHKKDLLDSLSTEPKETSVKPVMMFKAADVQALQLRVKTVTKTYPNFNKLGPYGQALVLKNGVKLSTSGEGDKAGHKADGAASVSCGKNRQSTEGSRHLSRGNVCSTFPLSSSRLLSVGEVHTAILKDIRRVYETSVKPCSTAGDSHSENKPENSSLSSGKNGYGTSLLSSSSRVLPEPRLNAEILEHMGRGWDAPSDKAGRTADSSHGKDKQSPSTDSRLCEEDASGGSRLLSSSCRLEAQQIATAEVFKQAGKGTEAVDKGDCSPSDSRSKCEQSPRDNGLSSGKNVCNTSLLLPSFSRLVTEQAAEADRDTVPLKQTVANPSPPRQLSLVFHLKTSSGTANKDTRGKTLMCTRSHILTSSSGLGTAQNAKIERPQQSGPSLTKLNPPSKPSLVSHTETVTVAANSVTGEDSITDGNLCSRSQVLQTSCMPKTEQTSKAVSLKQSDSLPAKPTRPYELSLIPQSQLKKSLVAPNNSIVNKTHAMVLPSLTVKVGEKKHVLNLMTPVSFDNKPKETIPDSKSTNSSPEFYECVKCQEEFSSKQTFIDHTCHNINNHKCYTCGAAFASISSLRLHNCSTCSQCGEVFREAQALSNHQNLDHGINCDNCDMKFLKAVDMMNHTYRNHRGDPKPKKITCKVCQKEFKKRKQLDTHMNQHEELKRFFCEFCGKRFIFLSQLTHHLGIHKDEKNFRCETCGAAFKRIAGLRQHIEVKHKGLKRYTCEICEKKLSTRDGYVSHVLAHKGPPPFKCDLCDKGYYTACNLKNHKKDKHMT